ncbi:hypothetical protein Q4489_06705 [Thalassotalea sp. 1_MG-2023]|nr:hypothetical protein [Thalassotalea sp. 1_MG-2023]MDO6426696.1 hypothetical protein [Thalassotalea sp. 1_MG-2023]
MVVNSIMWRFMSAYGKNKVIVIDKISGNTLLELPTGNGLME